MRPERVPRAKKTCKESYMSLFEVKPGRARSNSIQFNMNENVGGIEIVSKEPIALGPITSESELEKVAKAFERDFRTAVEAARRLLTPH